MGALSSSGQERPRTPRRSIRFAFAAMVAVPVVSLVLLWGALVSATLGGALEAHPSSPSQYHRYLVEFAVLVGAGLVVVLVSAILIGLFARRLSWDVSELEATARNLADERLPQLVQRLRSGAPATPAEQILPRPHTRTKEIARAAAAIASLQHTAMAAAAAEASLRKGLGQVFVSLARRNQSLLQRQLHLIDGLEQKAADPAALGDLFPLDHLTTRMRRHAEGLIILSGAAPGRSWSEPVPVIDVIRGAVAEVEDYKRVVVLTRSEDVVAGSAATDMIHLLAELIENATMYSPSGMRVEVRADRVATGFVVEVDDRGLGIQSAQLSALNQRLASPPDFDLANADQLGLFVVGKLAARHGVRVSLRRSPYGGTTAVVLIPGSIVLPVAEPDAGAQSGSRLAIDGPAGLDLPPVEALALTGPRSASHSAGAGDQPGNAATASSPATAGQADLVPADLAKPTAGTHRGLPRRVRQASLSPRLEARLPATSHPPGGDAAPSPAEARAPEEARDLVASFRSGSQRGRETEAPDSPAGGSTAAVRGDLDVPDSEET